MILSAGLTPAWQQVMVFDGFRFGEVNRAAEVHWFAQGKVLNAGIAAYHLDPTSLTLSVLGGPAREPIEREFASLGIPRHWIITRSSTRVCTTILDRTAGTMTELVENGRPVEPDELDVFLRAYVEEVARAEVAVIAGSLPIGTPPSFYRKLLTQTKCSAVLDFRGPGLLDCLELRPLLVKPNREELAQTVGRPLDNDQQLIEAMRSLNRRGAQWVAVTAGARPVWLTSESKTYRLHPPPVDNVVNPLGSGDSMAAAIAWAIRMGRPIVEAVRLGIAAAQENLRRLDTGRIDPRRVQRRANNVIVNEL